MHLGLRKFALALCLLFTTLSAQAAISLSEYDYVDPKNLIPDTPLKQALTYFKQYKSKFPNQNYLAIIDFTKRSTTRRLFIVNMKSGQVETHAVAVGKNSDPDGDGYATKFSNTSGSNMSSLGFYRTAEVYYGDHGRSMRLDGLSPTNSNARSRAIVMHPATYVDDGSPYAGRSWGCPALDPDVSDRLITALKNGALLYAWYKQ